MKAAQRNRFRPLAVMDSLRQGGTPYALVLFHRIWRRMDAKLSNGSLTG